MDVFCSRFVLESSIGVQYIYLLSTRISVHDLLAKRAGSGHSSVTYINLQLLSKSRLFTELDGQRASIRFNSVCEAPLGCFTSYFDVFDVNEASSISSNSRGGKAG